MGQLQPIISCFIKILIGLTVLVLAYPGCPGKEAVKRVSLCQIKFESHSLAVVYYDRQPYRSALDDSATISKQKKCTTTKNKQKTKAMFNCLL